MKLPLPSDTQTVLNVNNVIAKTSNLGLLLNKYASVWSDDWATEERRGRDKVNLKSEFLDKVEKQSICVKESKAIIDALSKRQSMIIQGLKSSGWHVVSFDAITDSRLIIGLGGTSVIETGMTLHPLYGFPYLPGSGLKGLARAYAEIAKDFADEETKRKLLLEIFGSDHKDPKEAIEDNRQGRVFFMDGLPTSFPKLELDIMNPHYGDYYSGKKDSNPIPPADYLNLVPVTFLAVAPGQTFSFALYSRDADLLNKAKEWLIGGLTQLGAGGKTNVGYGYFKDFNTQQMQRTNDDIKAAAAPKDNSLLARLKAVKNPETFSVFIKELKADDMEKLKMLSFKGMESVINIGLLGTLESAEISAEIKKVIAQKMLEICKEPDKKYTEKLEKYRKLQALGGI
ncbi:MAG: type III-B CRISPR module RAMP protein Cmr6 [Nitrospirota bacterium]